MIAAVRYDLAAFRRSGRWLGPFLALVVVLAVVYAGDPGPARSAMAATSLALVPLAAWGTRSLIGPVRGSGHAIVVTALGGRVRAQLALLVAGWCAQVPLTLLAVGVGLARAGGGSGGAVVRTVLLGLGLHLAMAAVGTAVGALFVPPLVSHPGYAVTGIAGASLILMVVRASPVYAVAHELMHRPGSPSPSALGVPVAGLLLVTLLGWALSALAAQRER